MNIAIISGSIRRNRGAPQVADWVMSTAERIAPEIEFTMLDLKELNLPFFDEPMPPQDAADTRESVPGLPGKREHLRGRSRFPRRLRAQLARFGPARPAGITDCDCRVLR